MQSSVSKTHPQQTSWPLSTGNILKKAVFLLGISSFFGHTKIAAANTNQKDMREPTEKLQTLNTLILKDTQFSPEFQSKIDDLIAMMDMRDGDPAPRRLQSLDEQKQDGLTTEQQDLTEAAFFTGSGAFAGVLDRFAKMTNETARAAVMDTLTSLTNTFFEDADIGKNLNDLIGSTASAAKAFEKLNAEDLMIVLQNMNVLLANVNRKVNQSGNVLSRLSDSLVMLNVTMGVFMAFVAYIVYKIEKASSGVKDMANNVDNTLTSLQNTCEKVGNACEKVGNASEKVMAAADLVLTAADEVKSAAKAINELVNCITEYTKALKETAPIFKIILKEISEYVDQAGEEKRGIAYDIMFKSLENVAVLLDDLSAVTGLGREFLGLDGNSLQIQNVKKAGTEFRSAISEFLELAKGIKKEAGNFEGDSRLGKTKTLMSALSHILRNGNNEQITSHESTAEAQETKAELEPASPQEQEDDENYQVPIQNSKLPADVIARLNRAFEGAVQGTQHLISGTENTQPPASLRARLANSRARITLATTLDRTLGQARSRLDRVPEEPSSVSDDGSSVFADALTDHGGDAN